MRDNASSVRFFLGAMLHDEKLSEGLTDQVLKLYDGYRAIAGRPDRAAPRRRSFARATLAPEAAASFLLSALNGLLIGFLFMGGNAVDLDGAVTMLSEWLFGDVAQRSTGGGDAPSPNFLQPAGSQENHEYASTAEDR